MGLDPALFERIVTSGLLVNHRLKVYYPVVRGVPRMLVFPSAAVRQFAAKYRERLEADFPGYSPPSETGEPGEEAVLRSFSREWLNYDWDERAYWGQSADDLYRSMAFALDLESKDLRDKLVLEVGIGIGGIANHLSRSLECELVGVDLSYAVDAAHRNFKDNPFFHIVQASAFAPPFAEGSFDYVFSQGVLHHTHSTEAAFQAITKLPREGGRLYVWLYSHRDEARTLKRRVLFGAEKVLRPVYSRLPEPLQTVALAPWAPLYIAHQWWAARRDGQLATYSWREAMHAARDRWTPRFVHRHSDEEVARWFEAAGYDGLTYISRRPAPEYVPESFTAAVGIEGERKSLVLSP